MKMKMVVEKQKTIAKSACYIRLGHSHGEATSHVERKKMMGRGKGDGSADPASVRYGTFRRSQQEYWVRT
jgi:hypothetical protein